VAASEARRCVNEIRVGLPISLSQNTPILSNNRSRKINSEAILLRNSSPYSTHTVHDREHGLFSIDQSFYVKRMILKAAR
jgi:hypothetical protein